MRFIQLLLFRHKLHLRYDLLQHRHSWGSTSVEPENTHPHRPNKVSPPCCIQKVIQSLINHFPKMLVKSLLANRQYRDQQSWQQRNEFLAEIHIVVVEYLQQHQPELRGVSLSEEWKQPHTIQPQILGKQLDIFVDVAIHGIAHILEHLLVDADNTFVSLGGQSWVQTLVESLREGDLVTDEG